MATAAKRITWHRMPWYPTVDTDACIGEQERLDSYYNDVFTRDEESDHPVVSYPFNCVLGCDACAQICPVEAITFPSREEFRTTLKALHQEKS